MSESVIRNDEQERNYLRALDLFTEEQIRANGRGKVIKWYGRRLELLITFYNKKKIEVGSVCGTTATNVIYWIKNVSKPNKTQLKKLAFLFEVDPTFFFLPKVQITINEQITITYESSNVTEHQEDLKTKKGNFTHKAFQRGNTVGDV